MVFSAQTEGVGMTLPTILEDRDREIWLEEQQQIQNLINHLEDWETDPADLNRLRQALQQLHELFLLVFVGEFNSGKSALINALLGDKFLEEGVTPTTERIHIIKFGQQEPPEYVSEDIRILRYPADLLREIHIVDTPGTNAVLRRHEAIARDFIPRSDMVIFVTSADRPFTESEREFLENIRQWGKKIVVAINKVDILETQDAVDEILRFVRDQVSRLLDFNLEIFPLSARLAKKQWGKSDPSGSDTSEPGFAAFRQYLLETLTQEGRIRLKLLSPLGVAMKIASQYQEQVSDRIQILSGDTQTLEKVERQLELFEDDTQSEFGRHMDRIENELLEMRIRGEEFLDDTMRLWKIRDMLDRNRVRKAFVDKVVAQTPEHIESHIQEIIDWLVERELRQWRLMAEELNRRRETDSLQDAAREAAGGFAYNRRQLIDSVGAQADQVIATFDKRAESIRMASTLQESVAMVGLVEVSAIGLGLILKALLVSATADATGLLAAGVLGVLGLAIIPWRRGVAKREMRNKMEDLRQQLHNVLGESFRREMEYSVGRLKEAIAPYRRFVLSEDKRLQELRVGMNEVQKRLKTLESTIEADQGVTGSKD
jgi:small GTP-binding protein